MYQLDKGGYERSRGATAAPSFSSEAMKYAAFFRRFHAPPPRTSWRGEGTTDATSRLHCQGLGWMWWWTYYTRLGTPCDYQLHAYRSTPTSFCPGAWQPLRCHEYINNFLCKDYMSPVSKLCTQSLPHSRGQWPPLWVATFLSYFHKHCVRPLLPPNNARILASERTGTPYTKIQNTASVCSKPHMPMPSRWCVCSHT